MIAEVDRSVNGNASEDTSAASVDEILKNARVALATITELSEAAKAAGTAAAESQRLTAAVLADAQTKLTEITSTSTQATAAKTQIIDAQAVIATKSDHIQKAQEHADTVRASLDRVLTAATQQATGAEAQKSTAESAAENAAELLSDIRTVKGSVETEAAAVVKSRKSVEESAALMKGLADKSTAVDERIASYEERLVEIDKQCAAQLNTIETLLRGATSAGLAHAFDARRQTFLKPHGRWQVVFVGSVLAIVLLAITGLWHVYQNGTAPTYGELVRLWLSRLPVAGALVWLALHASRESGLAKRLEEDYEEAIRYATDRGKTVLVIFPNNTAAKVVQNATLRPATRLPTRSRRKPLATDRAA